MTSRFAFGLAGALILASALPLRAQPAAMHPPLPPAPRMSGMPCMVASGSMRSGMMPWGRMGAGPMGMMGRRFAGRQALLAEAQAKQQADLQGSLQALLNQLVGSGKAIVRVHLELERAFRRLHNTLYSPVKVNGKPVAGRFDEQESWTVVPPGGIQRMTIAVLLPTSVGAAEVPKLAAAIAAAAGLDPARRDVLAIHRVPLAP